MTPEGYYVVGYTPRPDGRPTTTETKINIPANTTSVSIGQNGIVTTVDPAARRPRSPPSRWRSSRTTQGLQRAAATSSRPRTTPGAEPVGTAGTNGLGTLTPGAVEMSNVDLAQEFTNMITAQRGFQANSRMISTADEMLQELVNLKH